MLEPIQEYAVCRLNFREKQLFETMLIGNSSQNQSNYLLVYVSSIKDVRNIGFPSDWQHLS